MLRRRALAAALLFAARVGAVTRLQSLNPLRLLGIGVEEPYLVEFEGSTVKECQEMVPVMRQLERKLGTKILRYDVWADPGLRPRGDFLDTHARPRAVTCCDISSTRVEARPRATAAEL